MAAGVATDLRKSFAMAAKGPSSMQGTKVKRGTVLNQTYLDAEERRVEEGKAAAKRGHKPKVDKGKSKKDSAKKDSSKKRDQRSGDKRQHRNSAWGNSHWGYEVYQPSSSLDDAFFSFLFPCICSGVLDSLRIESQFRSLLAGYPRLAHLS
jgi:hypothetical protein